MKPSTRATSFTVRTDHRFPVACPLYYLGCGLLGKGVALNLSRKGWSVEGDQRVHSGQGLAFRLILPEGGHCLDIPHAIVRWSHGRTFGVEWVIAGPMVEQTLLSFIRQMAAHL